MSFQSLRPPSPSPRPPVHVHAPNTHHTNPNHNHPNTISMTNPNLQVTHGDTNPQNHQWLQPPISYSHSTSFHPPSNILFPSSANFYPPYSSPLYHSLPGQTYLPSAPWYQTSSASVTPYPPHATMLLEPQTNLCSPNTAFHAPSSTLSASLEASVHTTCTSNATNASTIPPPIPEPACASYLTN